MLHSADKTEDLSLGLNISGYVKMAAAVSDGCNILCLLTWQVAFLVHPITRSRSETDIIPNHIQSSILLFLYF